MEEDYTISISKIEIDGKGEYGNICLHWESPELGFGEYVIYVEPREYDIETDNFEQSIYGDSNDMDDENKVFTKKIMEALVEKISVC